MGIDIERLGPAAQKQVREELERRRRAAAAKDRQQKARDGPALRPGGSDRGSALEEEYYRAYIWPKELAGTVANVERHKKFELLPKSDYCGLRLPAAHYTPDFVIEYRRNFDVYRIRLYGKSGKNNTDRRKQRAQRNKAADRVRNPKPAKQENNGFL